MSRRSVKRPIPGLVGVIRNGSVIGSSCTEPDIFVRRHEDFISHTTAPRFRFHSVRGAIMWNSYPPTEEDMIVAENWLFRKGVTPLMHACAYVFDSTSPLIGA